jgi:hypothetical protein
MPAKSFRGLVAVLARYRPVNSRTRPEDRVLFYFLIAHNDLQTLAYSCARDKKLVHCSELFFGKW